MRRKKGKEIKKTPLLVPGKTEAASSKTEAASTGV
jgi:hypothetical protein